jgi:Zn-dependent protease
MQFQAVTFIFSLVVTIFSVVLHELAHGYMAKSLGDDTAERAGRLTLNPIPHLDPIGSVLVPILMYASGLPGFAWAKPVPDNPANLSKDRQWGPLKVSLAGPATNIVILVLFGLAARFMITGGNSQLVAGLTFVALVNAFLAVLNLVPVPPFDGFRLISLFSRNLSDRLEGLGAGGFILAFVVIFLGGNLIATVAYAAVSLIASPVALQVFGTVWQ